MASNIKVDRDGNVIADDEEGRYLGGGGESFNADSAEELIDVIDGIVSGVSSSGTTIVQPAVTIDQFTRLSHREEV